MTEKSVPQDWESYFCPIEGALGNMCLNLALAGIAPLAEKPVCGIVSLSIQNPRENGMPAAGEGLALFQIETALQNALVQDGFAVYAGCCTAEGIRQYYFYAPDAQEWEKRTSTAMAGFQTYHYTTSLRDDHAWMSYFEFLYPTRPDMHFIFNRRQLKQMTAEGRDITKVCKIDHSFRLLDVTGQTAFSEEMEARGFLSGRVQPDDVTGAGESAGKAAESAVIMEFSREDKPDAMHDVIGSLLQLEDEFEIEYLGWSSMGGM